jgi:hypothetical protein
MNCTTPLFNTQAPTCFDGSPPSSGSFLDPSELLEMQIKYVVYHIMCDYVACVPECCGSVGTTTLRHITTHYMIHHLLYLHFK